MSEIDCAIKKLGELIRISISKAREVARLKLEQLIQKMLANPNISDVVKMNVGLTLNTDSVIFDIDLPSISNSAADITIDLKLGTYTAMVVGYDKQGTYELKELDYDVNKCETIKNAVTQLFEEILEEEEGEYADSESGITRIKHSISCKVAELQNLKDHLKVLENDIKPPKKNSKDKKK